MDGIENLIEEYKMINSNENMSLEYEFNIDGGSGCYYVEMDSYNIVKERLEFRLNKKRGCYFNIEDDDVYINEKSVSKLLGNKKSNIKALERLGYRLNIKYKNSLAPNELELHKCS